MDPGFKTWHCAVCLVIDFQHESFLFHVLCPDGESINVHLHASNVKG